MVDVANRPRGRTGVASLPASKPAQFALPALGALLACGAFAQGAFFPTQALVFSGGLAVLAFAISRPSIGSPILPLFAFLSLSLGILVSWAVNGWTAETGLALATLVAAGSALRIGRALIASGERSDLLELLCWIGATVAAVGLIGVVFHADPWAMKATGLWRAAGTFTYANALGAFLVLVLPAPLILGRSRSAPANGLVTYLVLAAIVASASRGALVAGLAAGAVLLSMGGRELLARAGRPALGALVTGIALLPSISGDGAAPIIGLIGIAIGAAIAAVPGRGSVSSMSRRPWPVVLGIVALPLAMMIASASGSRLAGSRLRFESDGRLEIWSAAVRQGGDAAAFGTGLGTLRVSFSIDGRPMATSFAHNEFIQALAETGAVGLVGLLTALGLLAAWALRAGPKDDERPLWAAAVAGCAAFVVQGATDFTWHFPFLVATAFLWLAMATTRPPLVGEEESK